MGMGGDSTTVEGCPRFQGQKVPWSAYFSLRASDAGSKTMLHEMLMLGTTREFHVAKRPTMCLACSLKMSRQDIYIYIYVYIYIYIYIYAGK